jgi:Domain of unknown function (DU1801)
MKMPKKFAYQSPEVAEAFETHSRPTRDTLLGLRSLIFETAARTEGVGKLQETLKWGQPSYLTPDTKSGSTIRIDAIKGTDQVALYVHCQTTLGQTFRDMYGEKLQIEGNRAILLRQGVKLPNAELSHCISLALTYHLAKKQKTRR